MLAPAGKITAWTSAKEAAAEAGRLARARGEAFCIVSRWSSGRGCDLHRVIPLSGFGLPRGWTLHSVVEPDVERVEPEPPEKTSSNGF
jgi:hypothetical protein